MEHKADMGERRGVCRVLVGKHKRKRTLGRHRYRWEDSTKIIFQQWVGRQVVD
jgi:hypothetical protein